MLVLQTLLVAKVGVQRRGDIRYSNSTSIGDESPIGGVIFIGSANAGLKSSGEIEVCPESATVLSARAKCSGNFLPRFSARRRIPEQAVAER